MALHLDENLITEILLRLPAKSVLRSRAVCKTWRLITADPAFLADHARHRPLEVLLYSMFPRPGRALHGRPTYNIDLELDALPVSGDHLAASARRRPIAHFPKNKYPDVQSSDCAGEQYCPLLASCDGLLLLRADEGHYLVCNPATRRWTALPRLDRYEYHREFGFYFHEPSGEYRLLCYSTTWRAGYYVLSAGADEPRRLDVQAAAPQLRGSSVRTNLMTTAVLHGHLHWLRHMEAGLTGQMVAFDTVAETFRRMPPPPLAKTSSADVLAADGLLMATDFGDVFVDLWVLEGYGTVETERWERRHRVVVPWQDYRMSSTLPSVVAGGDGGDVVLGTHLGLVVYNVRRKTARVVDVESEDIFLSQRVHRESMVRHGFFDTRPHPGMPLFRFS